MYFIYKVSSPIKAVAILHCGQWAEVTALTLAWSLMAEQKQEIKDLWHIWSDHMTNGSGWERMLERMRDLIGLERSHMT